MILPVVTKKSNSKTRSNLTLDTNTGDVPPFETSFLWGIYLRTDRLGFLSILGEFVYG